MVCGYSLHPSKNGAISHCLQIFRSVVHEHKF
jgi:hypothetical protein